MAQTLNIQVWSYNFDPEPTGIAPTVTAVVRALRERGHRLEVVTAHPHYPDPVWGRRVRPYREVRDDTPVLRLPLWIGRSSTIARARQELSYLACQTLVAPFLGRPDVLLAVSPSFPALLPAMVNSYFRGIPWVLWLKDILPDGAQATGQLNNGAVLRAMRSFEVRTYRSASHVVVIADSFVDNLAAKGVPAAKITRIRDCATRTVADHPREPPVGLDPVVLCMGNIGHTQGLEDIVSEFEDDTGVQACGARLVIAGSGVAEQAVRAVARTDRVEFTGLLFSDDLEKQLQRATLGAVTQRYGGADFNVPSKLMNYMACGLPVVASLRPNSEAARLIEQSGAGWVTDSSDPSAFARKVAEVSRDRVELVRRSAAGIAYAREHLTPAAQAAKLEEVLFHAARDARVRRAAARIQPGTGHATEPLRHPELSRNHPDNATSSTLRA